MIPKVLSPRESKLIKDKTVEQEDKGEAFYEILITVQSKLLFRSGRGKLLYVQTC